MCTVTVSVSIPGGAGTVGDASTVREPWQGYCGGGHRATGKGDGFCDDISVCDIGSGHRDVRYDGCRDISSGHRDVRYDGRRDNTTDGNSLVDISDSDRDCLCFTSSGQDRR